jgi:hypothetical protein
MQSVEAEDLFEIHPLLPSCRLIPRLFLYTCPVVSVPASLVFSKSSRYGAIFPSSGPFTYSYMLHVSVAFRIWLLGRFKGER